MLSQEGFDQWAEDYEKSVGRNEEDGKYPFAGYREVLNIIFQRVKGCAEVLDIGFGTGALTSRLYDGGCRITGIDFSQKMIDVAKRRMPNAYLIRWDFSKGLPEEVKNRRFDAVVSTYALHHLTDGQKAGLIRQLSDLLNPGGQILIGDVSFETRSELEKCREKYREDWDRDETYFVSTELKNSLGGELFCEYQKMSHCAGVLSVTRK